MKTKNLFRLTSILLGIMTFFLLNQCSPGNILAHQEDKDEKSHYYKDRLYMKIVEEKDILLGSLVQIQQLKEFAGLAAVFKEFNIKTIRQPFRSLAKVYEITFDSKVHAEINGLINELKSISFIEYAEEVPIKYPYYTPNDSQLANQNYLNQISALNAFDIHRGSNVKIAIIDLEVRTSHEDLVNNIWKNELEINGNLGLDDDDNGYIDDYSGWDVAENDNNPFTPNNSSDGNHGTPVSGIAGAVTDNNIGLSSIGFKNKIIPIKSSNNHSTVTHGYEGILYAIAAGADIINISWGAYGMTSAEQDILDQAISEGILIVAAAGKDGTSVPVYPAAYPPIIAVASVDNNDVKSTFSHYGPWIDICAPGNNIITTSSITNIEYITKSGTSMACPMVAGLAALIKSRNPTLTPTEIEDCIKNSADNIDDSNPSFVDKLGSGRINAFEAIKCNCPAEELISLSNITHDQVSQNIGINTNVIFSCSATNAIIFNWTIKKDGEIITSQSSNTPSTSKMFNQIGSYEICISAQNENPECVNSACTSFQVCENLNPQDVSICPGNTATLTVQNPMGGNLSWYENVTDNVPLFTGEIFTTQTFQNSGIYEYFVEYEEELSSEPLIVGLTEPPGIPFGTNAFAFGMYYTASVPFYFHSVDVESGGSGGATLRIFHVDDPSVNFSYSRGVVPGLNTFIIEQKFPPGDYVITPHHGETTCSNGFINLYTTGFSLPMFHPDFPEAFKLLGANYNPSFCCNSTISSNTYPSYFNFKISLLDESCSGREKVQIYVNGNDNCSSALTLDECTLLDVNCSPEFAPSPPSCSGSNPAKSLWYQFEINQPDRCIFNGIFIDFYGIPEACFGIYDSCTGVEITSGISGNGDNIPPSHLSAFVENGAVTPGNSYFIQISTDDLNNGPFKACIKPKVTCF